MLYTTIGYYTSRNHLTCLYQHIGLGYEYFDLHLGYLNKNDGDQNLDTVGYSLY